MELCPIMMRVVKSQLAHSLGALAHLAEAGRGARLTEIASRLGAPKSSVQRLLQQLADEGWVEQDAATGHYRLTLRLAVLGQRYLQAAGIADATEALLEGLARRTRELARLTVVDAERLVWIGSAQGAPPGLMYQPARGRPIVSYATANGKAWLATLAPADADRIAARDGLGARARPADTGPKALRSIAALRRELNAVRARGYAIADEEAEPGVAAIAVAIMDPVRRIALGTTSVAGPVFRLTKDRHEAVARELKATAAELARIWPLRPAHAEARAG
jgi:DNA-binding IclR family transcriptional regulator